MTDINNTINPEFDSRLKEFEYIANYLPHIIWTSSKEGCIQYYNSHWYNYTGMTMEEIKAHGLSTVIHPDDFPMFKTLRAHAYETGEIFEMEYRLRRLDNTYRWHLARSIPVRDKNGTILKWCGSATDIHDSKLAQEKLMQSMETFSIMIEGDKSYAIYFVDPQGQILTWNSGAERIKGYSSQEIVGKNFSIFFTAEDLQRKYPQHLLERSIKDGVYETEGWRVKKDGSLFWATTTFTAMYDSSNNHIGYSKITRDATEKKKIEDQLKDQNKELESFRELAIDEMQKKSQMLNAVLNNLPIGLFRIDKEGVIEESLMGHWKRSDYSEKISKGQNIFDAHPEWRDSIRHVKEGQKKMVLTVGEERSRKWFHENYLFPDTVRNEGIMGFIIDVSEKTLVQNKIKESEEKFRGLVESAPDAIVIANECGEIELVNSQTQSIFGYKSDELIGSRIEKLIPDRFKENHKAHRAQFYRDPNTRQMGSHLQLFGKRKDGSEFPVEVSLSPLKIRGGMLISAAIRDVTERKEVEIELQKARIAAENANVFKSRFLANMSHEIRTPLNAIIGFADVLQSQDLKQYQRDEYLNHIKSSGSILLKLIGDILDLSKIEEGKLDLVKEKFLFKEVITSGVMAYKYKANMKGLDFVLEYDERIPEFLYGDSYRIKQIMINLIGNAIKFTKEGKIVVSISMLAKNELASEATLKISISDTGIGVPVEKQKAIFESFTQADNSILREYGGSGLGLSIVSQLVKLMNGSISLSSFSQKKEYGGQGTTIAFIITLPIADREEDEVKVTEEKTEVVQFSNEVKILVVEDNLVNQRLAKILLHRMGCIVDFANNGKEAIEMVSSSEYTMVLMDIQMPVMDGYDATRYIRSIIKSNVPIIGLTANVFNDDITDCKEAGMDDFLGKPYSEIQLYNMILKWSKTN